MTGMDLDDEEDSRPEDQVAVQNHVRSLMITGHYSDLTLKCGTQTFAVHKCIVCRCNFFANAAEDAPHDVIELKDIDAETLDAVLQYLYLDGYELSAEFAGNKAVFHVKVYAAAEKYKMYSLNEQSMYAFHRVIESQPADFPDQDFLEATKAVYDSKLLDSRHLKMTVLQRAARDKKSLFGKDGEGRQFCKQNPAFAVDFSFHVMEELERVEDKLTEQTKPKAKKQKTKKQPSTPPEKSEEASSVSG